MPCENASNKFYDEIVIDQESQVLLGFILSKPTLTVVRYLC